MPRLLVTLAALGAALMMNAAVIAADGAAAPKQKVVYHITDAEVAGIALRNAQNHINAVGAGNLEIVFVTHGKGIDFLLEDWKDSQGKSYDTPIQDLANQGVKFEVCNNTLTGRKISPDKLDMNAAIVPAGVARVTELQMQGFAYLKP